MAKGVEKATVEGGNYTKCGESRKNCFEIRISEIQNIWG